MRQLSLLAVPPTLHVSLMARLDRLGPIAGRTSRKKRRCHRARVRLRTASADWRAPGRGAAIWPRALDESRSSLCERLTARRNLHLKHALVQDVAYETLLRSRRQDLHARIAREIRTHFPEIGEQRPELLAHHAQSNSGVYEHS